MQMRPVSWCAAWVACLGLLLPTSTANAQTPAAETKTTATTSTTASERPKPAVTDVTLRDGGTLFGIVVDGQGAPAGESDVTVSQAGKVVTRARTNKSGQFSAAPLKGGVYQVATTHGSSTLRVWDAQTAPPASRPAVLLVDSAEVVRGQIPFRQLVFSDALILGAIIAAAIAIPIAIAVSSEEDAPSGS